MAEARSAGEHEHDLTTVKKPGVSIRQLGVSLLVAAILGATVGALVWLISANQFREEIQQFCNSQYVSMSCHWALTCLTANDRANALSERMRGTHDGLKSLATALGALAISSHEVTNSEFQQLVESPHIVNGWYCALHLLTQCSSYAVFCRRPASERDCVWYVCVCPVRSARHYCN